MTSTEARRVISADPREVLRTVEQRVLWLATAIVHHTNRVRPNRAA